MKQLDNLMASMLNFKRKSLKDYKLINRINKKLKNFKDKFNKN